jgi:hypothetical protein
MSDPYQDEVGALIWARHGWVNERNGFNQIRIAWTVEVKGERQYWNFPTVYLNSSAVCFATMSAEPRTNSTSGGSCGDRRGNAIPATPD